ncbi:MAG: phosphoribosylamine--glycine ligase, partial [Bdellovibrionales bacterium]|nr:phosphoribosylamine--glycine ligase [Bdellovibrionales bacterium]
TLQKKNIPYCGIIYAGLMMTNHGLFVLEFNARFGDPETQVIIPRLDTDLIDLFLHAVEGTLDQAEIRWKKEAAITIVMASKGYPESSQKGVSISGLDQTFQDGTVFHAGTQFIDNCWKTNGGRVLSVTTLGSNLKEARQKGYQNIHKISFEGAQMRTDIGKDI